VKKVLFDPLAFPSKSYIHFYLQLIHYLLQSNYKTNILNDTATVKERSKLEYQGLIQKFFQELDVKNPNLFKLPS
jgi:hypothetical protein